MTYGEVVRGLGAHLRANAALLGCDAPDNRLSEDAIEFGKYGDMPMNAPFVLYYVAPAGGTSETLDNYSLRQAEITIFCGAALETAEESHIRAVEMAEAAAKLLEDYIDTFLDDAADYQFDTFYSSIAVAYATAIAIYSRTD